MSFGGMMECEWECEWESGTSSEEQKQRAANEGSAAVLFVATGRSQRGKNPAAGACQGTRTATNKQKREKMINNH